MRTLYHTQLSPFCRKVRVSLAEKKLAFVLEDENPEERRPDFLALNPACDTPVLVEEDGTPFSNSTAIVEYLEDAYPDPPLFSGTPAERGEIRRLNAWFDIKFNREVTVNLVGEKLVKRLLRKGQPDSKAIYAGHENCRTHMEYVSWLVQRRHWLAGDAISMADITAGAHVSCVDYLGDVSWDEHQPAKEWYARLKSRPSFREILADHVPGEPPPKHYADLDF